MALYLGNNKVKLHLGKVRCQPHLCIIVPAISGVVLLSKDGYLLKDANGLYLSVIEPTIDGIRLLSAEGYLLTDSNELYLTTKEIE